MRSRPRHDELDVIRGLAALTVVITHVIGIGILQQVAWWPLLNWSPLRLLFAGHQAVIMFFVLSGFVLSLPFHDVQSVGYARFAAKRIARIWIPYAAAILAVFVWRRTTAEVGVPLIPQYSFWQPGATWRALAAHLTLIGDFDVNAFVPAAWSLVHEMRISLCLPVLLSVYLGMVWWHRPVVALSVSAAAIVGARCWPDLGNWFLTLHYTGMFMVGATLAGYRQPLVRWASTLTPRQALALALASLALYIYPFDFAWTTEQRIAGDWFVAAGAAGIIAWAMARGGRWLSHGWLLFLGRISYSLYLVHMPVIFVIANRLGRHLPLGALYGVILPATIVAAWLFWFLVERPTLDLCRRISRSRISLFPV